MHLAVVVIAPEGRCCKVSLGIRLGVGFRIRLRIGLGIRLGFRVGNNRLAARHLCINALSLTYRVERNYQQLDSAVIREIGQKLIGIGVRDELGLDVLFGIGHVIYMVARREFGSVPAYLSLAVNICNGYLARYGTRLYLQQIALGIAIVLCSGAVLGLYVPYGSYHDGQLAVLEHIVGDICRKAVYGLSIGLIAVREGNDVLLHFLVCVPGDSFCILIDIELYQGNIVLHLAGIFYNGEVNVIGKAGNALDVSRKQGKVGDINGTVRIDISCVYTLFVQLLLALYICCKAGNIGYVYSAVAVDITYVIGTCGVFIARSGLSITCCGIIGCSCCSCPVGAFVIRTVCKGNDAELSRGYCQRNGSSQ